MYLYKKTRKKGKNRRFPAFFFESRYLSKLASDFVAGEHMFAPVFASENVCSHRENRLQQFSTLYIEKRQQLLLFFYVFCKKVLVIVYVL